MPEDDLVTSKTNLTQVTAPTRPLAQQATPPTPISVYLWGTLCIGTAVMGAWGLFLLVGLDIFGWVPWKIPLPPPPRVQEASTHGNIITAAVSLVAGVIGLGTFFLNRWQKDQHLQQQLETSRQIAEQQREQEHEIAQKQREQEHEMALKQREQEHAMAEKQREQAHEMGEKQREQARAIAEAQRALERQIEDEKERRERDLAELQRLESQFGQLAANFASTNTIDRINAAIGLAELAVKPDPRRQGKNGEPPTERDGITGSTKNAQNYPYFLRATNRLGAALHQWENQSARDEVRKALRQMTLFAKDAGTTEPLLHDLVNALADTNRAALNVFTGRLARCWADGSSKSLSHLVVFCEFFDTNAQNLACLRGMLRAPAARAALQRHKILPGSTELKKFRLAAQTLLDARDALVEVLQSLSRPAGMPDLIITDSDDIGQRTLDDLEASVREVLKHRKLDLNSVFLQGAFLPNAQLQGVDLRSAQLQGAVLEIANIQVAELVSTNLQDARLRSAILQGSNFSNAVLKRANFELAKLQGALLNEADVEGANFNRALGVDASIRARAAS